MLWVTSDVPGHQFYCDVPTRGEAESAIQTRIDLTFGPGMAVLADGTNVPPTTTKFVYYIRRGVKDEILGRGFKECAQWI